MEKEGASNILTGSPAHRSPYFNLVELDSNGVIVLSKPSTVGRRQDSPSCFDLNASIYVWQRDVLLNRDSVFNEKTLLFLMPEERSRDIDSELDFEIVELLAKKRRSLHELS